MSNSNNELSSFVNKELGNQQTSSKIKKKNIDELTYKIFIINTLIYYFNIFKYIIDYLLIILE